jgi:hypothetical protein
MPNVVRNIQGLVSRVKSWCEPKDPPPDRNLLGLVIDSGFNKALLPPPQRTFEDFLRKTPGKEGVQSLDVVPMRPDDWLRIDRAYDEQINLKRTLIRNHLNFVCNLLPDAHDACAELLYKAASHLSKYHSGRFAFKEGIFTDCVRQQQTDFKSLSGQQALAAVGRITQEDLILVKAIEGEKPKLMGGCLCFPTGWEIVPELNNTVTEIHKNIPGLNKNLGDTIDQYLWRLKPNRGMERSTFVLSSSTCMPRFGSVVDYLPNVIEMKKTKKYPEPHDMYIRNERQTFTRLEESKFIVFSIKIYVTPLKVLPPKVAKRLHDMLIYSPDEYVSEYKESDPKRLKKLLDYLRDRGTVASECNEFEQNFIQLLGRMGL